MKKIIGFFLLTLLLVGCVTNPVTEKNFHPQKQPLPRGVSWLTGIVPGLTQLLNREYLEMAIYVVATAAPFALGEVLYPDVSEEESTVKLMLSATGGIALLWSYGDGVYTTYQRRAQWEGIAMEQGMPLPATGRRVDVSRLRQGMNIAEVLGIFPRPTRINVTESSGQKREQWVYHINGTIYLYFDNGILTSWQY